MKQNDAVLIGVDWGTSRFRAFLIDADGRELDRMEADQGLLSMGNSDWSTRLEVMIEPWLDALPELPVVLCGMVGSAQGWLDAGYAPCPAGAAEIAALLKPVSGPGERPMVIVPGLEGPSLNGGRDVMRGEESQLIGLAPSLRHNTVACLPGTHTKWVRLQDGSPRTVTTHLSGELFGLLTQHSILAPVLGTTQWSEAAFMDGLRRSEEPGGLTHHLFGVRVRGLEGGDHGHSYLSGVIIGHEITAMQDEFTSAETVVLVGAGHIATQYSLALQTRGVQATVTDPDVAVCQGLLELARISGITKELD